MNYEIMESNAQLPIYEFWKNEIGPTSTIFGRPDFCLAY